MQPTVSVILPTYDRAYVLWKAVQSVLAQTYGEFELIVVDDGSTDCTSRLLEEFRDARIRELETPNRGPSAARNAGLELAEGEFVAYLDSDNTWKEGFLGHMLAAAQAEDSNMLWYCGADITFWERSERGTWSIAERWREEREPYDLDDAWRFEAPDTNCILHRREVAEAIGGWDENCRWLEDWDFFLRVCLEFSGQVSWVPEVLVDYRQVHGDGADGICAEAREDGAAEVAGRQYLLDKWGDHPDFAARDKLAMTEADLRRFRS